MKCKETVKLEKEPAHEILVLIAYAQMSPLNAHADIFSGTSGLNLIRVFRSIQTMLMRAAKALGYLSICPDSTRQCDK